jgi:hypothetical protein
VKAVPEITPAALMPHRTLPISINESLDAKKQQSEPLSKIADTSRRVKIAPRALLNLQTAGYSLWKSGNVEPRAKKYTLPSHPIKSVEPNVSVIEGIITGNTEASLISQ